MLLKKNERKFTITNSTNIIKKDFDYLVSGWKAKIVRCGDGSQKWGLFYCEK